MIDVAGAEVLDVYRILIHVVTPRPIAWVSTLGPGGEVNLAPYSFFGLMGSDPGVVAFAPGDRPDGTPKDTATNTSGNSPSDESQGNVPDNSNQEPGTEDENDDSTDPD